MLFHCPLRGGRARAQRAGKVSAGRDRGGRSSGAEGEGSDFLGKCHGVAGWAQLSVVAVNTFASFFAARGAAVW